MTELSPNSTLSHYRILSKIGEGGMGEVYLAEDIKLDRKVALKILPLEFAKDKERMSRFVREAKSASALNHPNILTIYEIDETESGHFIATEFIAGETLRDRARRVPITLSEALEIATQTANALAAAHNAGIIHRDIKPENVMVREDGLVKVLDFGLAKLTAEGVSDPESETRIHSETQPGMIMGTVAYMSPQQARGQILDIRTDVWSFGVLLYELLSGRQPFRGDTPTDTLANILQREPEPLNISALPPDLSQIIRKMLAKDLTARYSTITDVLSDLKRLQKRIEFEAHLKQTPLTDMRTEAQTQMIQSAERLSIDSGAARADEGFWVAVLPFKHRGGSSDLEALADGLSEEIVTGLSRFSYLKVIARSSTLGFTESADIRSVGKQLGARYVMEGSIRQAGQMLRVAVQLVDTNSGAHIWAETYNRTFNPESVFDLQDDLVPRIVSTVADRYGALVHSMSESVRSKGAGPYTPHEAMLRGFGFHERVTPQEHSEVRTILEAAVVEAPDHSNCNAMLASLYWHEYSNGFNTRPDPLGRALAAARQGVETAPANNLAHYCLATALFFKKDFSAFRPAAERAIALNPMDASSTAFLGILISYSGDWEYGRRVRERAMELNPHHPSWYFFGSFYDAYRQHDYRGALDVALKVNMPGYLHTYASLAAAYGQLGEIERARVAVKDLLALTPNYGSRVRELLGHWFDSEMVEHLIEGLRKAGLVVVESGSSLTHSRVSQSAINISGSTKQSILVLPFTNISADPENEYFSDGLTEELISDLSKVRSLRVISRSSAMKLKGTTKDLKTIATELNVRYILDGSVRKAGQNLRISVQLIDGVSDENLWSEKYNGTLADIFEMQESVSRSIVDALKITLSADEERDLAERPISDAEAYDLYLQARSQFLQGVPAALDRSIELLTQGLDLIGENELLYAALGYSHYVYFRWISKLDDNRIRLATECMQKVFALNPSSSHGFVLKGLLSYSEGNMAEAIRSLKQALAVDPNNTEALFWLAVDSSHVGDNEAAMKYADRLLTLDPLLPINVVIKGVVKIYKGKFNEALLPVEQGLAMDASSPLLIWTAAIVDAWAGRSDEAITHIEKLVEIAPDWVYTQHGLFLKHALRGEKELALQYDSAELTKEAEHDCHFALHLAHCFALVHENEKALDFLQLSVRTGMVNYPFLSKFDPLLENIRNEERFTRLMSEAKQLSEMING